MELATMSTSNPAAQGIDPAIELRRLAPRPVNVEEAGLSARLIGDLITKHLYSGGVLDLVQLSERLCLAGSLLDGLLAFLRQEGQVEVRGRSPDSVALRYALTERGRTSAMEALDRDGYIGPAPISLDDYVRVVQLQSVKHCVVSREQVHSAFADTVIRASLLDQLGPALHSGKAMFIYGAPGTGKSFISRRLSRLLGDSILVPQAIAVNDSIIAFFDPRIHKFVQNPVVSDGVQLTQGHDPRFRLCERPLVITGGELTLDILELQFNTVTRCYQAPLQLLANNGMMVIDDLGRQRVTPIDLFNRWIVPLEEKRDFLVLQTGQHFAVPFDVALTFSTNLDPLALADEAFLRRIGYKIRFETLTRDEYGAIWQQECQLRGIEFDPTILQFLFDEFYTHQKRPLVPCHPRDLIDLAQDYGRYNIQPGLSREALRWAWENYFVKLA